MIRNQRGLITIDFIFALVLVFAFTAIIFTLSLTLSVIEVTQYITFASSRNAFAGHLKKSIQEQRGKDKFAELSNSKFIKPLYSGKWFELKKFNIGVGDAYQQLNDAPDKFTFYGASVFLRAPVLNFKVPFFGRTQKDENSTFEAQIASWLAREPSTEECLKFNQERLKLIKQISGRNYGASQVDESKYYVQTDNGC